MRVAFFVSRLAFIRVWRSYNIKKRPFDFMSQKLELLQVMTLMT